MTASGPREALGAATPAERLRALLAVAVDQRLVPGAVALVSQRGEVVFHEALGWAALEPGRQPMTTATLFDLASLTKPLACTPITLALVDRGLLSLDDHISEHLPELAGLRTHGVTVRRILAHCSGLPGWRPLYAATRDLGSAVGTIAAAGLAYEPGTRVEYSCPGFICLGIALERITGCGLNALFRTLVAAPLNLGHTGYGPVGDDAQVAASERDNAFERELLQRAGLTFGGWRDGVIHGEVHDGNACYAMSGVSGNAGLFGDAADVARLGGMWLHGGQWQGQRVLSAAGVRLALSTQSEAPGQRRGLGWVLSQPNPPSLQELVRPPSSPSFFPEEEHPWVPRSCGEYASEAAFGHTGFTGTSLWVDPASETVAVLLTNATHPSVPGGTGLAGLRARFHNIVLSSDWTETSPVPT